MIKFLEEILVCSDQNWFDSFHITLLSIFVCRFLIDANVWQSSREIYVELLRYDIVFN